MPVGNRSNAPDNPPMKNDARIACVV